MSAVEISVSRGLVERILITEPVDAGKNEANARSFDDKNGVDISYKPLV